MLSNADWAAMAADLAAVRNDNAVSIVIRRGSTTLNAQSVRIAQKRPGSPNVGDVEASISTVTILGGTTLDIAVGDRFTTGGNLYEVTAVAPNVRVAVRAWAKLVQ